MKSGKVKAFVFATIVIFAGVIVAAGNRTNDAWHYFLHGDDRITFDNRHFVNPTPIPAESTELVPTDQEYFGQRIYVSNQSDLKVLPAEIFIKKNGQVIGYSLSGGF